MECIRWAERRTKANIQPPTHQFTMPCGPRVELIYPFHSLALVSTFSVLPALNVYDQIQASAWLASKTNRMHWARRMQPISSCQQMRVCAGWCWLQLRSKDTGCITSINRQICTGGKRLPKKEKSSTDKGCNTRKALLINTSSCEFDPITKK